MRKKLMAPAAVTTLAMAGLIGLLAGCSSGTTGTLRPRQDVSDSAQPSTSGQPAGSAGSAVAAGDEELAKAFTVARDVDPCALHDPAVAASVAGMPADQIMPGRLLNSCDLELAPNATALSVWNLSATVGVKFDARERQQEATPEQLGDIQFFHITESGPGSDDYCRYVMPFGPGDQIGIELRVRRDSGGNDQPTKAPCEVAQGYLRGVAKYWAHPALRTDNLTTPTLTIAHADPCAALGQIAAGMGKTRMSLSDPHACLLTTTGGVSKSLGMISAEYAVELDPRPALSNSAARGFQAVTVAGHPGVSQETPSLITSGTTCSLTVVVDDQITLQADQAKTDSPKSVQVVKTRADTCQVATQVAETLLTAIH